MNNVLVVLVLSISIMLPFTFAEGAACSPAYHPPAQPYVKDVYSCLYTVIVSINRGEEGDYHSLGKRLVIALLTANGPSDAVTYENIPWDRIAEVTAVVNSQPLVDLFVKTIGAPRDGEETDASYAQLYAWRAPMVLKSLSKYKGTERTARIDRLAWAIANFYWGHINMDNYKRVPIGPYWELLDTNNPLRPMAKEVEKSLIEIGLPKNDS